MSMYYSEDEIHYMDHNRWFWDEMSGKQLDSEEVVAARLDQIKNLHPYDVHMSMRKYQLKNAGAPELGEHQ